MNYIITKHPDFFNTGYDFCNLEDMDLPEKIAIDTETTGLKPVDSDIFAIQIGTGKNNYLIHCYDNNYTVEDVIPYLKDKILVGQNLLFDLQFFYKHKFYPEKVRDTFIASKILHNGEHIIRHGFGDIFKREMGIVYNKTEQKNIHVVKLSTDIAIKYCFNDVDRLLELINILEVKIDEGGYRETYDLHCEYIKALAYLQICGVPVSEKKWKAKIIEDKKILAEKEKEVKEYIYKNLPQFREKQIDMFSNEDKVSIQLSSPKQMISIFKDLGVNVLTDNFKESISEDILRKSSHEFIKIWLEYQSAKHDVTTFGENILEKIINGRIYSAFNPILDTARISTRKGDVNTLNLPANARTRDCFTAGKGFKMVVADYEGQETRVGADITGDQAMIDSILKGADLHCAFARVLYPELETLSDEEIIKNHKKKRNDSKSPRFCFQFGGTGYTLALNEGLPVAEGMRIEGLFKQLHTGIYSYGDKKLKEALKLGYIESTAGFKLHLPNFRIFQDLNDKITRFTKLDWTLYREGKTEHKLKEEDKKYIIKNSDSYNFYQENKGDISRYFKLKSKYFRLCLNNPTQTTAAHQTKKAVCMLFDYIKDQGHLGKAKICIIPHDEIVLEVRQDLAEQYKEKLGEFMRIAGDYFIVNNIIKMGADANIGDSWYEAK